MSLGFLGTFLLNNFLRETFILKKSILEEKIENSLNKKVNLGNYSGIRFLGVSLANSKIIDKENKDNSIKAERMYLGIMPIKSFLNQKWVFKIRPENTEINVDRYFFSRDKSSSNNKNISKSEIKYDLNFKLPKYSVLKSLDLVLYLI